MRPTTLWLLPCIALLGLAAGCSDDSTNTLLTPLGDATYRVTFDAVWSAATHPNDFPPGPHFSGLIGATHGVGASFWQPGALASPGIESMAEAGSKSPLTAEIDAAIQNGTAGFVISGGGISPSPGAVSVTFTISPSHSRVTLVSMIAPSPDWFVGVTGLDLIENGSWVQNKSIDLPPYDAGTDDGVSFVSPNAESTPHAPIQQITVAPFSSGVPLGTFTFVRQS